MFRVATFAAHRLSLAHSLQTQARLQQAHVQISSGKKSQDYAGISTESRRLVNLEGARARAQGFMQSIERTDRRLQSMETAASGLFEVASRARVLLIGALNANNSANGELPTQFAQLRELAASHLNTQLDGRYFFAGSRTDVAPVDLSNFDPSNPSYAPDDPANGGYYVGNGAILAVRADADLTLDYGITADNPAFDKLLRGLELVRTAPVTPDGIDRTTLEQALSLIKQAGEAIPDLQARMGRVRATLEQAKTQHADQKLYMEEAITDIENVDIAEATARITADQVQLEASFAVTARLSQLNLIDFLR